MIDSKQKFHYERGLYRHYKNGKTYRLLFIGVWCSETRMDPAENEDLHVCARYGGGSRDVAVVYPASLGSVDSRLLCTAKWSGNGNSVKDGEHLAVYIALYDEGRVSVRPLDEFEATVDIDADVDPIVTGPRFERIGD